MVATCKLFYLGWAGLVFLFGGLELSMAVTATGQWNQPFGKLCICKDSTGDEWTCRQPGVAQVVTLEAEG